MKASHDVGHFNSIIERMQDYYLEVSYGQFVLDATVTEKIYTLDNEMSYYGANNDEVRRNVYLARDSVEKADPDVNFGAFGKFIVIHAGAGEETDVLDNSPNDIWSNHIGLYHMYAILGGPIQTDDGTLVKEISIVPETHDQDYYSGSNITGVVCHEFGHDLGLPDLYDVSYSSDGIGLWGLMSGGPNLNNGYTPCHPTAWSKILLGWVDPIEITENTRDITIRNVEEYPDIFKITLPNSGGRQYFLIENKARVGFDSYLPHGGLLIWHIDEAKLYEGIGDGFTRMDQNTVNTDPDHKGVDLEEASGAQELDDPSDHNNGDRSDPWYNSKNGFNPTSNPNTDTYAGEKTEIHIRDVSLAGASMTFSVTVEERKVHFTTVDSNTTTVMPGETHSFVLEISSNRVEDGPVTDWISLNPYGDNWKWLELSENPVELSGKHVPSYVYANVTVPPDSLYGDLASITITASSNDSTPSLEPITLTVTAGRLKGFKIDPTEDISVYPGEKNNVSIHIWLNNTGNAPEEFSISLKALSDSAWDGELFAGGDSMLAGKSKVLEVHIESYSLYPIYINLNSPEDSLLGDSCKFTLKMEKSGEKSITSFNATVLQVYDLSVSAEELEETAKPREHTALNFLVTNLGNGPDNISLELSSKKAGWDIELTPRYMVLEAGGIGAVKVSVEPHRLSTPGEAYEFTVIASSKGGKEVETRELSVTVEEYDGMTVEVAQFNATKADGKNSVTFDIKLTNDGSSADVYAVTVIDMEKGFDAAVTNYPMDNVEVDAYGTKFLKLKVTVDRTKIAGTYPLVVKVGSRKNLDLVTLVTFNVTVGRSYGFEATHDHELRRIYQNGRETFYLTVNNTSNTNITVLLETMVVPNGLTVTVDPSGEVRLPLGGTETFEIRVQARSDARGKKDIYFRLLMLEREETEEEIVAKMMVVPSKSSGEPEEETGGLLSGTRGVVIIAAAAVFIIGVIIALLLILGRRRKKGGMKDDDDDDEGGEPGRTDGSSESPPEVIEEFDIGPSDEAGAESPQEPALASLPPIVTETDPTDRNN